MILIMSFPPLPSLPAVLLPGGIPVVLAQDLGLHDGRRPRGKNAIQLSSSAYINTFGFSWTLLWMQVGENGVIWPFFCEVDAVQKPELIWSNC